MQTKITKEGYSYSFDSTACSSCGGKCCTGESGYIYLNSKEIQNIAALLSLSEQEFVSRYLFKKGYKYSIKEREVNGSFECVFFNSEYSGCSIYEARPVQCRTFPFWDYYKMRVDELKLECPGVVDV